ncbi:arginine N-succinyltransferase [Vibrio ponticus]|nr:arginine N-succinyltransferase [Vibrio ponticus]
MRNIESVRHSFRAKVAISEHSSDNDYLISNTSFETLEQ